jgi:hypothetical protein
MRNADQSLTLNNLARLRGLADRSYAIVVAAGDKATKAQRETARFWSSELFRLRPSIIKANADRFPADVIDNWIKS